jgi:hypothetical protein
LAGSRFIVADEFDELVVSQSSGATAALIAQTTATGIDAGHAWKDATLANTDSMSSASGIAGGRT